MKTFLLLLFSILTFTLCTSVSQDSLTIRSVKRYRTNIIVNFDELTRRLEVKGDSGIHAELFVIGDNEYHEVDTFIEGFIIFPVSLSLNDLKPDSYVVIVKTEDTTVQQLIFTYYY
jgi:hypothetical protein